ncbi:MAG TPA: DUF3995 domain-containing protein [Aquihabitans sp.]|jgi:hypothetical protein|nr:DUF3995 domain-containing protein [Aquihabitans sp.]
MARPTGYLASAVLAGIAALHVAWGRGSSFPYADRDEVAAKVVGSSAVPPPAACYAVAGALVVASGLAADVPVGPPALRRMGRAGVATVLGVRGVLGRAGRTDVASPGSDGAAFRRLDRRIYSPLCLALAAATVTARRP